MTFVDEEVDRRLERKSPTEAADIDEIVRGMLAIQAQAAAGGKRPLSRGTHAKGICVRAEFEVLDLRQVARRSRARRASGAGHLRRARHLSRHRALRQCRRRASSGPLADVRAMSFSIDVTAGGSPGSDAPRLFDEHRDHVSHQRRARVRGGRPRAVGARHSRAKWKALRSLTRQRFRQPAADDPPRAASSNGHAAAAVPAASILEHGAVPATAPATP